MTEEAPLEGLRVVVTRARHQAHGFGEAITAAGATAIYLPVIEIVDPESFAPVDFSVRKLANGLYSWVIFSSANSIEYFMRRVDACGLDARAFAKCKIATVGSASEEHLRRFGLRSDLVPDTFTGATMAEMIGRGTGKVLLPRVEGAPHEIVDLFVASGWSPEEVTVYRNVLPSADTQELAAVRAGRFDVVTFTSASSVRNFAALAGDPADLGLAPASDGLRFVACIGPQTAEAARALGFRVDILPARHTTEALESALVERFTLPPRF